MIVYGLDLSSPSNPKDTVLTKFRTATDKDGQAILRFESIQVGLTDADLFATFAAIPNETNERIVVGIDSPLSYSDGGGSRASDESLRRRIQKRGPKAPLGIGMQASSIMSPLYISSLTMRGMHIARNVPKPIEVVEVHPGATMGLHLTQLGEGQLPKTVPDCVLQYKQDGKLDVDVVHRHRKHLLVWMEVVMGMKGIPSDVYTTTHQVDACAAALAAWKYGTNEAVWSFAPDWPQHPYPYSC